jgi:hypothetical protein
MADYKFKKQKYGEGFQIERTWMPSIVGDLALKYIERWGMVCAEDDGEDAAGRQKVRPMTPDELVARAATIAKMAVEKLQAEGWIIPIQETDSGEGKPSDSEPA